MSDLPGSNTVPLHKTRAGEHLSLAGSILSASPEWSRVASFYSAFHTMKVALLQDPIFDDISKLATINVGLTPESRLATHHQGNRARGRSFGVNDLVRTLYREFYSKYLLLHGASVTIRYGDGCVLSSAEDCLAIATTLHEALVDGRIVHQTA